MAGPEGFEPTISGLEGLRAGVGLRLPARRLILAWPRAPTALMSAPFLRIDPLAQARGSLSLSTPFSVRSLMKQRFAGLPA